MNADPLPPAPKCPKGAQCPGAATHEAAIYIPDCLYIGGHITEVLFECPSCSSRIIFGKDYTYHTWKVIAIKQ